MDVTIKELFLLQLKLLAKWLKENNCKDWNMITEFKRVLLQMSWKSMSDVTNCGIYLMHHIETFNGEDNWQCDFKDSDQVKYHSTYKYL